MIGVSEFMSSTSSSAERPPVNLSLPPIEEIAREALPPASAGGDEPAPAEDPALAAVADAFVQDLLDGGAQPEVGAQHAARAAIDNMGIELQQQAARRSAMLQQPLRKLAHQGDEGGPVARSLLELREKMEQLDPRHHDLSPGVLDRLTAVLPGMGNRLQRYFRKYETAQAALDAIIADLQGGADMLRRDNVTLGDDQDLLRSVLQQLDRQVQLGKLIDRRLVLAAQALPEEAPRRMMIEEELLFPLRQRVIDLQQQLAVSQQGVLALEVVIRNNRELIRGVERAINVTVSALNVAVTVALALANQRLVLDRVEALNRTTADLIAGAAKALRSQGVEIQNRASSAMLDMQQLQAAFADVLGAIDEVARYRRDALPKLDAQIDRLSTLAQQGADAISRLDAGNAASPHIVGEFSVSPDVAAAGAPPQNHER